MARKKLYFLGLVFIFVKLIFYNIAYSETKTIGFAAVFPELTFEYQLRKEEQTYLGIHGKKVYRLNEIKASLLLIEFLNIYCVNCVKQAPLLNEVYSHIQNDKDLKENVKIIGIAAGNNINEVKFFKDRFEIPYPIFPDPNFSAHEAVGAPRTPFMIWVRKGKDGKGIVVSTHLGVIDSSDKILEEIKVALQYDLDLLQLKVGSVYEGENLKPPIKEEEIIERLNSRIESLRGKLIEFKKIVLKDGDSIYMERVDFDGSQNYLFSKLVSRRAVCDVCHDTFFLYTFNTEGKIIDLIPIQLTKIGNRNWTEEDIKKLKTRVIGRSIFKSFSFDPRVDSISGATITAVLIFDSLEKARQVYEKLRKEGYIKD